MEQTGSTAYGVRLGNASGSPAISGGLIHEWRWSGRRTESVVHATSTHGCIARRRCTIKPREEPKGYT